MTNPSAPGADAQHELAELSCALEELRDSLLEAAMALKDIEFENNLRQRQTTYEQMLQLFASLKG